MTQQAKNYVWGVVGILVIILIIVLAHGHKAAAPTTDTSTATTTGVSSDTATTTTDQSSSMDTSTTTTTTADGLQMTVLKQGTGAAAVAGDTVTVNYTGSLADGTVFDSNTDPKFGHVQPFQFQLGAGQVIQGWDEGVLGMKVGEEAKLVIPPALGYGAAGAGSAVPPNATLTFDVTVTAISHS